MFWEVADFCFARIMKSVSMIVGVDILIWRRGSNLSFSTTISFSPSFEPENVNLLTNCLNNTGVFPGETSLGTIP